MSHKKDKKNKSSNNQDSPTKKIEEFKLYKDPQTNEVPEIVINLVKGSKYIESINNLLGILREYRDPNTAICFKVRSVADKGQAKATLPEFLIRCSDLYIIGYKIGEDFRVFDFIKEVDQDGFPSLQYTSKQKYQFGSIKIRPEENTSNIKENWKALHTIGYVLAESIRDEAIQEVVAKSIEEGRYSISISDKPFKDEEYISHSESKHCKAFENIVSVTLEKIKSNWASQDTKKEMKESTAVLEEAYRELISGPFALTWIYYEERLSEERSETEEERILMYNEDTREQENDEAILMGIEDFKEVEYQQKCIQEKIAQDQELTELREYYKDIYQECQQRAITDFAYKFLQHYSALVELLQLNFGTFLNAYEYEGTRIKALNNSNTEIVRGKYTEEKATLGKYSKSPGSEKFTFNNNHYYKPDEDKGSNAIHIDSNSDKDDNSNYSNLYSQISAYLNWLSNLPKYLQNEMLNSTAAQNILASIKQTLTIYHRKSVTEEFNYKLYQDQSETSVTYNIEDTSQKAQVLDDYNTNNLVDLTIILATGIIGLYSLPGTDSNLLWNENNYFAELVNQYLEVL